MKQRNRQEHQLNQLQNKLAKERRQTENLAGQQEELHTHQDKLRHQVESERTANTRLREVCTRLKQNVEMVSRCRKKSQAVYKCLACDGTSGHMVINSRNLLQCLNYKYWRYWNL